MPAGAERAVIAAAGRALGRSVEGARPVGGGDINEAWMLDLDDGARAFLKSRPDAPADEFGAEAAGLRWLSEPGGLAVPEVLAVIDEGGTRGLVLEWIEEGERGASWEEDLGRGLACIHAAGADRFDVLPPDSPRRELRFGGGEVESAGGETWAEVYALRLRRLADHARGSARITAGCVDLVESVAGRLADLTGPDEPPARIHGDLWSGNVVTGADGRPWIVDPKAHGGHREMDLAMLELFGSVSAGTVAAYEEVMPLAEGWHERIGLWQLQPLLVHAILFGGSYGQAVERTAQQYG